MASREMKRINPTGIRLRRSFEQQALKHMLERLDNSDEKVEALCKLMHAYCELIRQDAALEKSRPTPESRRPVRSVNRSTSTTDHDAEIAALAKTVRDLYGVSLSPDRPDAEACRSDRPDAAADKPAAGSAGTEEARTPPRSRSQSGEN